MMNKKRPFGRCCYCDMPLNSGNFSREHVVPTSRSGSNKRYNKLPCCKTCNQQKGNKTVDEYIIFLRDTKPYLWEFKVWMATKILSL